MKESNMSMRTEKEMMELILNTARGDERVLAVYLKGSRTNPNVLADIYQDFDVMYVVRETESFRTQTDWLNIFGKIILKQEQDEDCGYGERFGIRERYEECYSWLLLFADGNRLDIGVETVESMKIGRNRNRLFVPLLDKIGCLPKTIEPTDQEFWIKQPTEKRYQGCCNEFFWSLCDVMKGIARDELSFAMTTFYGESHNMLEHMLQWYIGAENNYSVSCGKLNKFFKRYLPQEIYQQYKQTYTDSDYRHFWSTIDISAELFHKIGVYVGLQLGFEYPQCCEDGFNKYRKFIQASLHK